MNKVPAPVPKTATRKPAIKNLPGKTGSAAIPIRPPIINRNKKTRAYPTIPSKLAIVYVWWSFFIYFVNVNSIDSFRSPRLPFRSFVFVKKIFG